MRDKFSFFFTHTAQGIGQTSVESWIHIVFQSPNNQILSCYGNNLFIRLSNDLNGVLSGVRILGDPLEVNLFGSGHYILGEDEKSLSLVAQEHPVRGVPDDAASLLSNQRGKLELDIREGLAKVEGLAGSLALKIEGEPQERLVNNFRWSWATPVLPSEVIEEARYDRGQVTRTEYTRQLGPNLHDNPWWIEPNVFIEEESRFIEAVVLVNMTADKSYTVSTTRLTDGYDNPYLMSADKETFTIRQIIDLTDYDSAIDDSSYQLSTEGLPRGEVELRYISDQGVTVSETWFPLNHRGYLPAARMGYDMSDGASLIDYSMGILALVANGQDDILLATLTELGYVWNYQLKDTRINGFPPTLPRSATIGASCWFTDSRGTLGNAWLLYAICHALEYLRGRDLPSRREVPNYLEETLQSIVGLLTSAVHNTTGWVVGGFDANGNVSQGPDILSTIMTCLAISSYLEFFHTLALHETAVLTYLKAIEFREEVLGLEEEEGYTLEQREELLRYYLLWHYSQPRLFDPKVSDLLTSWLKTLDNLGKEESRTSFGILIAYLYKDRSWGNDSLERSVLVLPDVFKVLRGDQSLASVAGEPSLIASSIKAIMDTGYDVFPPARFDLQAQKIKTLTDYWFLITTRMLPIGERWFNIDSKLVVVGAVGTILRVLSRTVLLNAILLVVSERGLRMDRCQGFVLTSLLNSYGVVRPKLLGDAWVRILLQTEVAFRYSTMSSITNWFGLNFDGEFYRVFSELLPDQYWRLLDNQDLELREDTSLSQLIEDVQLTSQNRDDGRLGVYIQDSFGEIVFRGWEELASVLDFEMYRYIRGFQESARELTSAGVRPRVKLRLSDVTESTIGTPVRSSRI